MHVCKNGEFHDKLSWCGNSNLTDEEREALRVLLEKLSSSCCVPHSSAGWTANECPACQAGDLLEEFCWRNV